MRRCTVSCLAALLLVLASSPADAIEVAGSLKLGYRIGPGGELSALATDLAPGLPLAASLSIGYSRLDPGNAAAARRIFINDTTNGTPEQQGRIWDYRFDLLHEIGSAPGRHLSIYGGPRYCRFTGNFRYIGGNEDFDVVSHQWGWGLGLESHFPMSRRTELVLSGGVDYYLSSRLQGHDTAYESNGEIVNGRQDYTYEDADAAINQPGLEPRMLLGLRYHFGH